VLEVRAFEAKIDFGRWKRDGFASRAMSAPTVVQDCVVTLDPVEQQIDEDLEAFFLPENSRLAQAGRWQWRDVP
jgi:hypothetical protein